MRITNWLFGLTVDCEVVRACDFSCGWGISPPQSTLLLVLGAVNYAVLVADVIW